MTPAEFKRKWARFQGKESAAYQSHFDDLCRLLGTPTPLEADPSGEVFCFQKRVIKDAELFALEAPDAGDPTERGFADVWKQGCFAWEYKGKKKNLDEAYRQLLRYRESLLNPPLLVVCDFDRYIIRTNFNGTVQETHEFTNDQLDRPENLALLRAVFTDPDFLKPQRTTNEITKQLAEQFAQVARSLYERESAELADAGTRAEVTVAQRKNLRIARFLNRLVFCFFAEDTGLLPKNLFADLARSAPDDPRQFAQALESLFRTMAKGGLFGHHKLRHFNGHLFEEATVFELTDAERRLLVDAAEADWQFVEPSIMGTLFARGLDPDQLAALGAQYTGRDDIVTLVEPVLMAPFRREWSALKSVGADVRRLPQPLTGPGGQAPDGAPIFNRLSASTTLKAGWKPALQFPDSLPPVGADVRRPPSSPNSAAQSPPSPQPPNVGSYKAKLAAFLQKLRAIIVMDPACGSGNFLYVALQMLLDLEKEVITYAGQLGISFQPEVGVHQLRALEINPYAYELAQVTVQIGHLQWLRANGFPLDRSPVLQNLDGFHNEDALLVPHYRSKAKTLKEAQTGEHAADTALKFYTERDWPACDVIVGNPPFLGNKRLRSELGDAYTKALFDTFGDRLPATSDLCCYWFEKARDLIAHGKCRRAGLLATTGSKQVSSRAAFERIQKSGRIFFVISDRDWFDAGTAVRICMVGFAGSDSDDKPTLDGKEVVRINADLTSGLDTTRKQYLRANEKLSFMGTTKVGDFDITHEQAVKLLGGVNPHGKPNSDVLRPYLNGRDLVQTDSERWVVDFGVGTPVEAAALYEAPFKHIVECVKPQREQNNDKWRRSHWWLLGRTLPDFREATAKLSRYIGTPCVSKHRVFVWLNTTYLPDAKVIAIAFDDDYRFGLLHSRIHELWTLATCGWHGKGNDATYNPTECFETFPFPFADDLRPVAAARLVTSPPPAPCRSRREEASPSEPSLVTSPPTNAETSLPCRSRRQEASPAEPSLVTSTPINAETSLPCRSRRQEAQTPPSSSTPSLVTSTPTTLRAAIAAAAQELNALRERWLNPPEWTRTEFLEFPATVNGPWARYVAPSSILDPQSPLGLARYPRLVPKDAACAAKLKDRTLTKLYNERPAWLALAHQRLDSAVAAAYGWPADLTDEQILERLLALNLARAAEEAKTAQVKKTKSTREKHPEEMI